MPGTCPPNTKPYVIQRFDNLYRIARRFNVTISAILAVNPQINRYTMLRIGETICIPVEAPAPPCPEGVQYRVMPGDSFHRIAVSHNITVDDLARANPGVDSSRMSIGQIICIPGTPYPPERCPPNTVEYVIKPGDTLGSLAFLYNTTVEEIMRLNPGLNRTYLRLGQKICLPRPTPVPRPGQRPGVGPGGGPGPGPGGGPGPGPGLGPQPSQRPGIGPGPVPGLGPQPGQRPGVSGPG